MDSNIGVEKTKKAEAIEKEGRTYLKYNVKGVPGHEGKLISKEDISSINQVKVVKETGYLVSAVFSYAVVLLFVFLIAWAASEPSGSFDMSDAHNKALYLISLFFVVGTFALISYFRGTNKTKIVYKDGAVIINFIDDESIQKLKG